MNANQRRKYLRRILAEFPEGCTVEHRFWYDCGTLARGTVVGVQARPIGSSSICVMVNYHSPVLPGITYVSPANLRRVDG